MKLLIKLFVLYILKTYSRCWNFCTGTRGTNRVLILKPDALGDYVLLRNFIYELQKSAKFANKKLVLIGNTAWQDFAQSFDNEVINQFIWLDVKLRDSSKWYFLGFILKLCRYKFDTAIYPCYSRIGFADLLMGVINAKEKIAFAGDLANISLKNQNFGNKIYTRLIPSTQAFQFEFLRNKDFFSVIVDTRLHTQLALQAKPSRFTRQFTHHIVLFVGAGLDYRRWAPANFLNLAQWLHSNYGYHIVVCGGKDGLQSWQEIAVDGLPFIHNLIGQTTITELIDILNQAQFIVSNETSAVHLAIALNPGKPVFVISNGNHLGRFTPYPLTISQQYHGIYPQEITDNLQNYTGLCEQFKYKSELDINSITLPQVQNMITSIIGNTITPHST